MRVQDDGDGMTSEEAKEGFRHLGGSWKRYAGRSKTLKRVDHGFATTRCATYEPLASCSRSTEP